MLIKNSFFRNVQTTSSTERSTYFIQVIEAETSLSEILYQPRPFRFETKPRGPQQIIMRRERQTFRRLPRSDTICFAVRTTIHPIDQLSLSELQNLVSDMTSWPKQIAKYKGRYCWGDCVLQYCRERGLKVSQTGT